MTKFEAFADDKLNGDKMTLSLLDRVENTEGKGENADYQHFPSVFSKAFFFWVVKSGFDYFRLFIVATGCPSERCPQKMVSYYGG